MGKPRTSINIDSDALRMAMSGVETFSERAREYGVTRQAINGWLQAGRIPPRAFAEIVRDLQFDVETVEKILTVPRTKLKDSDPARKRRRYKFTIFVDEYLEDEPPGGEGK